MSSPLPDATLDQLFRNARTQNVWHDKPVAETLIRAVYDLTKMGPTSANCSPSRFVWLGSADAKAKLEPFLMEGNRAKTMSAPWTLIVATDMQFFEKMPQLFPQNPDAKDWFSSPDAAFDTGFRNGTLQGGYLIMAARAIGLDCGPMSGFDRAGVDKAFFEGADDTKAWKSNFLINIGYGNDEGVFPRLPRLSFDEACLVL